MSVVLRTEDRSRESRVVLTAGAAALLVLLVGCAAKRPVLYPNAHWYSVGRQAAESDIDDCMALASGHGAPPENPRAVAKSTVTGAAVGGATGAAASALSHSRDAGEVAAAGAAGGAVAGMVGGFASTDPDPVHRQFVDKCLRDQGYDLVGWR